MSTSLLPSQTGIVKNKEGESVILLPPGPIQTEVVGKSGIIYAQTLIDDPDLGHPTARLESVAPNETPEG